MDTQRCHVETSRLGVREVDGHLERTAALGGSGQPGDAGLEAAATHRGLPGPAESIGAIWAADPQRIIGADGAMLWRVPADFHHFKAATLGGILIMGRTTFESLGGPLPGREHIVLTHNEAWSHPEVMRAGSISEACEMARRRYAALGPDPRGEAYCTLPRLWVIGGGSVYTQAVEGNLLDEILISQLDLDATSAARASGVSTRSLVYAPVLPEEHWQLRPSGAEGSLTDPDGRWREPSGDAAWRLEHWESRAH